MNTDDDKYRYIFENIIRLEQCDKKTTVCVRFWASLAMTRDLSSCLPPIQYFFPLSISFKCPQSSMWCLGEQCGILGSLNH